MTRIARSISLALLGLSLLLISIGGLYGGLVFLADPSGGLMGMSLSYLDGLPIHSYLLPGIWLLTVMGAGPLLILYGLWMRPSWSWTAPIERHSHVSWAWTAGLVLSIVLLLQLGVELLLGMLAPPTYITGALGLIALVCLLLPWVRAGYALPATRQVVR
jgi:hypothetical protein